MRNATRASLAGAGLVLFCSVVAHADTYKSPRTKRRSARSAGLLDQRDADAGRAPASLGNKLVLSEAEAQAMEKRMAQQMAAASAPSDPNEVQRAGQAVGGYNMFWADFGTQVAIVNGERRSSLIVDPPQGECPSCDRTRKSW
jgi:hypothetical protein